MRQYGPIGQEFFSAFQAGVDAEKFEELLYSHLPPAFGSPCGFCMEQGSTKIRRIEATAYAYIPDTTSGSEDISVQNGMRPCDVRIDLKLRYKPETDLSAVMLVRAKVNVSYKAHDTQEWVSYEKMFIDIDEALEEVERVIG